MKNKRRNAMKNLPSGDRRGELNPTLQKPAGGTIQHTELSFQHFTGPMPHPDILHGYNTVQPGAAERIIRNFEAEAAHRRSMEEKVLQAEVDADKRRDEEFRRGQYCALTVAIASLIAAVTLGIYGQQWASAIVGTLGIGSIVTAFLRQKYNDKSKAND